MCNKTEHAVPLLARKESRATKTILCQKMSGLEQSSISDNFASILNAFGRPLRDRQKKEDGKRRNKDYI